MSGGRSARRSAGAWVCSIREGIAHGDLTTSNMIWSEDGSGSSISHWERKNADLEELGVDIHLLNEAFQSAHSHILRLLWDHH